MIDASKTWKIPEENSDFYWRIQFKDGYLLWERLTDELPGEHFKAHDLRQFGGYASEEQSYGEFLESPFRALPEQIERDIRDALQRASKEEMRESQEAKDAVERYYWVPVEKKEKKELRKGD